MIARLIWGHHKIDLQRKILARNRGLVLQSPIGKVVVERPEVGTHATNYHFGDIFGEEDRAFLIRKMALKSHAGIYPTFPCTNTFNV